MTPRKKKQPPLTAFELLDYIYGRLGNNPSDDMLKEAVLFCEAAKIGLLGTITDPQVRAAALKEIDNKTAQCIQLITEMLHAVEEDDSDLVPSGDLVH